MINRETLQRLQEQKPGKYNGVIKEVVFSNKDYDTSDLNINELKFLEYHYLKNDLIHYPFRFNDELKLINLHPEKPEIAEKLVQQIMKTLLKGLQAEADYLKKEVMMLTEFRSANIPLDLV